MQTHKRNNKRWSESENNFIRENYSRLLVSTLAEQLGRSEKATRNQIERLGCRLSTLKRNEPKPKIVRKKYKGWHLDGYGRKQISINGRTVAEHRFIVEKSLGRKLLRKEQVHHINCDKRDNRLENLHLFKDVSSHLYAHRSIEKLAKELMERNIIKFNSDKGEYQICKAQ